MSWLPNGWLNVQCFEILYFIGIKNFISGSLAGLLQYSMQSFNNYVSIIKEINNILMKTKSSRSK